MNKITYNFKFYINGKIITGNNYVNNDYENIISKGNFTSYLSIGAGSKNENFNISNLIGTYKTSCVNSNFNPIKGELFVEKIITLPNELEANISEIGFSDGGINLLTYTYFDKPIEKKLDTQIQFSVILALKCDGNVKFLGENNNFVKLLLGDYETEQQKQWEIFLGNSTIPNINCVRNIQNLKNISLTEKLEKTKFTIESKILPYYTEIIYCMNKFPVMRYFIPDKNALIFNNNQGIQLLDYQCEEVFYVESNNILCDFEYNNLPLEIYDKVIKLFNVSLYCKLKTDDNNKYLALIDIEKIRVTKVASNRMYLETLLLINNMDYDLVELASDGSLFCFNKVLLKLICCIKKQNGYEMFELDFNYDNFKVAAKDWRNVILDSTFYIVAIKNNKIISFVLQNNQLEKLTEFDMQTNDFIFGLSNNKFYAIEKSSNKAIVFLGTNNLDLYTNNLLQLFNNYTIINFDSFIANIIDKGKQSLFNVYNGNIINKQESNITLRSGFTEINIVDNKIKIYVINLKDNSMMLLKELDYEKQIKEYAYIENGFVILYIDGTLDFLPINFSKTQVIPYLENNTNFLIEAQAYCGFKEEKNSKFNLSIKE